MNRKAVVFLVLLAALCLLCGPCLYDYIHARFTASPWKVAEIDISDKMNICLYFKAVRPESPLMPYNGTYRILSVTQAGKRSEYYDIPVLLKQDRCCLEVYWYPTNHLVRLKEKALSGLSSEFFSEHLLDLERKTTFSVIRGNDLTHIVKISEARDDLSLPLSLYDERTISTGCIGNISDLRLNGTATVSIGRSTSKQVVEEWTTASGEFIGVLKPTSK